ncbi:hypothetical protein [Nocardia callitridis]
MPDTLTDRDDADEVVEELMARYDGVLLSAAPRPGAGSFGATRRAGHAVLAARTGS